MSDVGHGVINFVIVFIPLILIRVQLRGLPHHRDPRFAECVVPRRLVGGDVGRDALCVRQHRYDGTQQQLEKRDQTAEQQVALGGLDILFGRGRKENGSS